MKSIENGRLLISSAIAMGSRHIFINEAMLKIVPVRFIDLLLVPEVRSVVDLIIDRGKRTDSSVDRRSAIPATVQDRCYGYRAQQMAI